MSRSYKISIIGSGRVALHLSRALEDAGHQIVEVYSRNIGNATKVTERLYGAKPVNSLDFSFSKSKVFFIAVADDALSDIAGRIILPENAIVAHTSGTGGLAVLHKFPFSGVFYPLQTFSKQRKISFTTIPLCLESDNKEALRVLKEIGNSISKSIYFLNSEKRKSLHLAAVFASNFTNRMLAISKEILEGQGIDYGILDALVSETVNKALEGDPKVMQTGPAARKDFKVMKEHLKLLENKAEWKNIYKVISEDIANNS